MAEQVFRCKTGKGIWARSGICEISTGCVPKSNNKYWSNRVLQQSASLIFYLSILVTNVLGIENTDHAQIAIIGKSRDDQ